MYLFTKEDRKVTITDKGNCWNYKKEFGSNIIENFDFTNDKLDGMLLEQTELGYKTIKSPDFSCYKTENGDKYWYKYCKIRKTNLSHREDGPAIECVSGSKIWFNENLRHRENGPAIESYTGHKEWWIHGRLHRLNGPAIEWVDGGGEWYKNGKLHREDGPAIFSPQGWEEWWMNGKRHRVNGPAIKTSLGYKEYWINGEHINLIESQYLGAE